MITSLQYTPVGEDVQFLRSRLHEYNVEQVGKNDDRTFSIILRDDQSNIIGGLTAWIWAQACEIELMWVHADHRRKGLGRTMMQMAEYEAYKDGCEVIFVSSYSFQAPGFYEKLGYEVVFQVHDFPPRYRSFFFQKN